MRLSGTPIRRYITELDGLRFFAILAVLLIHYQPPNSPRLRWMSLGWCGVDLFFVLSGYLITNILLGMRGTPHPYKIFYWRRALRIFPLYYAYLLLIAVLNRFNPVEPFIRAFFFLTSVDSRPISTIVARLSGHMSFVVHTTPIGDHLFFSPGDGLAMIWSLSIEELFYLFWAPIILRGSRKFILYCAILPILICPVLRGLAHVENFREYFQFLFRADALMFGAIVALAFAAIKRGSLKPETLKRLTLASLLVPVPLLLLLTWHEGMFQGMEIRSTYSFALFGYTLCGLLFAGIVAWCIANTGSEYTIARLLRTRPLTYIGRVSFCMYLAHILTFVIVLRIQRHYLGAMWMPDLTTACLAALLTLSVASFSWFFVESKILSLKDRLFPSTMSARTAVKSGT